MRDEQLDEDYEAEVRRAYRSVSWGCLLFILGLIAVAVALLVLGSFFSSVDVFDRR